MGRTFTAMLWRKHDRHFYLLDGENDVIAAWGLWTQVCLALRPMAFPGHRAPPVWAQPLLWASLFPNLPVSPTPLASPSLRCQPVIGLQGNGGGRRPQMKEWGEVLPRNGMRRVYGRIWERTSRVRVLEAFHTLSGEGDRTPGASHPSDQQRHVTNIYQLCGLPPRPPAPSADADVEAVGIQCLADPGSHAPQQGVEAADFEFPACGQACPSTVHAAMNGCPGASPAHGRSVSILRRLLSRRAESQRWRHLDSAFTSRAREKAQRSRQTPEAQGQSKGHSSLEDTQAAWGFRALLT